MPDITAPVHLNTISYGAKTSAAFRDTLSHAQYDKAIFILLTKPDASDSALNAARSTPPPPTPKISETVHSNAQIGFESQNPPAPPSPQKPEIVHNDAQSRPSPQPGRNDPAATSSSNDAASETPTYRWRPDTQIGFVPQKRGADAPSACDPQVASFQRSRLSFRKNANLATSHWGYLPSYDLVMKISLFLLLAFSAIAQETAASHRSPVSQGADQKVALKITDAIYQGVGFGNTFMVTTPEGNVIIDTSGAERAPQHVKLLKQVSSAPVKYIILTHGHGDHTGGVALWKEPGTQIIAQKNHVEFMNYQKRLQGFFISRNAAQFEFATRTPPPWAGNYGAKIEPTILFDDKYEFKLGGVTFRLLHTPGETPDHLTVWIPEYRAAFSGDNYYTSFPNMYTLRGTEPRWALDYVESLNKVIALDPELLLPSHGRAIRGHAEITAALTKYRDAILYVHDETVKGMNQGKDIFTLMREVHLPANLDVGESYGRVSWSVRGIYEGYAGWFDLNPATMYDFPPTTADADLVHLAGGPDAVIKLASERVSQGRDVESLRLLDAALAADPGDRAALEVRVKALQGLIAQAHNSNERGWLESSLSDTKRKLNK